MPTIDPIATPPSPQPPAAGGHGNHGAAPGATGNGGTGGLSLMRCRKRSGNPLPPGGMAAMAALRGEGRRMAATVGGYDAAKQRTASRARSAGRPVARRKAQFPAGGLGVASLPPAIDRFQYRQRRYPRLQGGGYRFRGSAEHRPGRRQHGSNEARRLGRRPPSGPAAWRDAADPAQVPCPQPSQR